MSVARRPAKAPLPFMLHLAARQAGCPRMAAGAARLSVDREDRVGRARDLLRISRPREAAIPHHTNCSMFMARERSGAIPKPETRRIFRMDAGRKAT